MFKRTQTIRRQQHFVRLALNGLMKSLFEFNPLFDPLLPVRCLISPEKIDNSSVLFYLKIGRTSRV